MKNSGSLANAKLPEPIEALEPFKERLHIINGLHGKHTSPSHSPFFGALGGYRGSDGVPPGGPTIDYELSKVLPETLLPHCVLEWIPLRTCVPNRPCQSFCEWSGAANFHALKSESSLSAFIWWISEGDIRDQHEARSSMLQRIEKMSSLEGKALPSNDKNRYDQYVRGFEDMNGLRDRLAKVSGHLKKFAPEVDERYTNPEFETDWHDTLLDLGISALNPVPPIP